MDARIHAALTLCVRAINLSHALGYYPNDAQQAQLDVLAAEVQPLMEALAAEPYRGKRLGCGYLGHHGYRSSWEDMMDRLCRSRSSHGLCWKDRMEVLFDTAGLDADAMLVWIGALQNDILRDHLLLHTAADLAAEGQMQRIEQDIIPQLQPDMAYRGARVMLMEYARRGDAEVFLRQYKRSDKRKERHTLDDACACLVEQVIVRRGIEAALMFCDQKGFGSYRAVALRALAATLSVQGMADWIAKHRAVFPAEPGLEESLLVAAYATGLHLSYNESDIFDTLFARVDTLDKSLRWGSARLRDVLLLYLGMAVGSGERRVLCRRKIGNASIKRELD